MSTNSLFFLHANTGALVGMCAFVCRALTLHGAPLESLEIESLNRNMVPIPAREYSIGKYEVSQALWEAVMGENPSEEKGAEFPVTNVSWDDCQLFLAKLNALPEVQRSGRTYRLPTAQEWEYSCLAGSAGEYCKLADGTEISNWSGQEVLNRMSWNHANSHASLHPVGRKEPNAFGLYDMHGNVSEWTSSSVVAGKEERRIFCGTYWGHSVEPAHPRTGNDRSQGYRSQALGFRLAADRKLSATEYGEYETKRKTEIAKLIRNMIQIPDRNFAMCKYEVTQALWEAVMEQNPSRHKGANYPVESLSGPEFVSFIEKLNELAEASGYQFRFPTKEEWRFACRAGAKGDYCLLADGTEITKETLEEVAWFGRNSDRKTQPVGQKKPNAFGLYDMLGNVYEIAIDAANNKLVSMGGGAIHDERFCTNYNNEWANLNRDYKLGIRLVADKVEE